MRNVSRALIAMSAAIASTPGAAASGATPIYVQQISPSARGLQAPRHLRVAGMRPKPRHRAHGRVHR